MRGLTDDEQEILIHKIQRMKEINNILTEIRNNYIDAINALVGELEVLIAEVDKIKNNGRDN